jgi:hypothetical protein
MQENQAHQEALARSVPQEQLEALQAELAVCQQQLQETRQSERHLREKNLTLSAKTEVDSRQLQEVQDGQYSPRPDWTPFSEHLDLEALKKRSSRDIAAAVLSTMDEMRTILDSVKTIGSSAEGETGGKAKFFVAKGMGRHVPKYLQWTGKIPNRLLGKAFVESTVNEIWAAKHESDKLRSTPEPLSDAFYRYLLDQHKIQQAVTEAAYNLLDGLERFRSDPDCLMFLRILRNELPEDLLADQVDMLNKLKATFTRLDLAAEGKITGKVPKKDLLDAVRKFFPTKSHEDVQKLQTALSRDQTGPIVNYLRLFEQTADMSQTAFVELLRDQHVEEIEEHMIDIEVYVDVQEMAASCSRNFFPQDAVERAVMQNPDEPATTDTIRRAFLEVDPEIPKGALQQYLSSGLGSTVDLSEPAVAVNVPLFLQVCSSSWGFCSHYSYVRGASA